MKYFCSTKFLCLIKEKQLLLLLMAIYYIIVFYPVLRSGYMYDDLENYTSKGWSLLHDMNIWQMTKHFAYEIWFKEYGRAFFFAWYPYALFSLVSLNLYKLLIVIFTFINGIVLSEILFILLKNRQISFVTLLIFPMIVSLDCSYFNAMYGAHFLVQMAMLMSCLGILFFQYYLESKKKIFQFISCIALFVSLGIYEVSFVLCIIYLFILIDKNEFHKNLFKIIPQLFVGIFWLIVNVYGHIIAKSQYDGVSINLGINVFWGFLKQLSGSTCIVNDVLSVTGVIAINELSNWAYSIRYAILIVIFILLFFLLKNKYKLHSIPKDLSTNKLKVVFVSLCLIVLPTFLIAVSARYQTEVSWGKGYMLAYISTWGIAVLIALVIEKIIKHIDNLFFNFLIIITLIFISIPNQIIADYSVDNMGNWSKIRDDLFLTASKAGVFDDWNAGDYILDADSYAWRSINQHYDYLLNIKVNAYEFNDLYTLSEDSIVYTSKYYELLGHKLFYYVAMPNYCNSLFYAKASDVKLSIIDNVKISTEVYVSNLKIFVPNNKNLSKISIVNENNCIQEICLKEFLINKTEFGNIYLYTSDGKFDITKVAIY